MANLSKTPYKGSRDFFPELMRIRNYIFRKMDEVAQSFAYEPYDGPLLEEVELYKAKSGEELINEQIYSFTDRGERFVAIRPEMTPTLARMVSQIHKEVSKPLRWYSYPNLMRYEKPQKGRLREHFQLNCDIFGAPKNLGEVEIFQVITSFLESFGADESMFEILINDREIVDFLLSDHLSLPFDQIYKTYKVIDKAKKVSKEALLKMLNEVIPDENKVKTLNNYLGIKNIEELRSFLSLYAKDKKFNIFIFMDFISKLGLNKYIKYDPTIVRGLDYYTGIVFEVFDKHPDNKRAIAGGGAYGNLLQIFNEEPLPGVGFGLGDVTLTDFLKVHSLLPDFTHPQNDLYLSSLDEKATGTLMNFASTLRKNELKVELNLNIQNFKKIFTNAEKKGHKFVAYMGESELSKNEIQIKNLQSKEIKVFKLDMINDIKAFLKNN